MTLGGKERLRTPSEVSKTIQILSDRGVGVEESNISLDEYLNDP